MEEGRALLEALDRYPDRECTERVFHPGGSESCIVVVVVAATAAAIFVWKPLTKLSSSLLLSDCQNMKKPNQRSALCDAAPFE